MKNHTPGAEAVLDEMVRRGAPTEEPKLTPEEKLEHAKKEALRLAIINKATEYRKTPKDDRAGKKYLLAEIQAIVDQVDDAFVLMVYDAQGIPTCITFNPNTPEPVDPTLDSHEDSLDTPQS